MIIIWKIDFHLDEGSFDWNYILKNVMISLSHKLQHKNDYVVTLSCFVNIKK